MKRNFVALLKKESKNLFKGSIIFFVSATIVNLGNYLFNLVLGRWLGPAQFSDLSIIITLLLIVMFFAATMQTITARFTAIHKSDNDLEKIASLRKTMLKWAWSFGIFLFLTFSLGSLLLQRFFNTQFNLIFIIFGAGLPFYLTQGVNRGILQGQTRFGELSATYQAEMWARLIIGVGFSYLGWGTIGAVAGLSLSFVATWIVSLRAGRGLPSAAALSLKAQKSLVSYTGGVAITYLSQIVITNSDLIIVKHFYPAETAGEYAALALIGRVVFFATWAITTALFPIVAQRHKKGQKHYYLLILSLAMVIIISGTSIVFALSSPELIINTMFGKSFVNIAPLLWRYAVVAALYSLANVFISYHLSLGVKKGGIIALIAGCILVIGLWFKHDSIQQIIRTQTLVMGALLASMIVLNFILNRNRVIIPATDSDQLSQEFPKS